MIYTAVTVFAPIYRLFLFAGVFHLIHKFHLHVSTIKSDQITDRKQVIYDMYSNHMKFNRKKEPLAILYNFILTFRVLYDPHLSLF